jgi:hypothetical protein
MSYSYRRGYGGKNDEKWFDSRRRILECLDFDWKRRKEVFECSRLSVGSFQSHIKDLLREGLVDKRVVSHKERYYKLTCIGARRVNRNRIRALLEQPSLDGLRPDDVGLYSDVDLNFLGDEDQGRLEGLLYDMVGCFRRLNGLIQEAYGRHLIRAHYPFPSSVVEEAIENEALFQVLSRRLDTSGVAGSIEKEDEVIGIESQVLDDYGLTHEDLEDNVFSWLVLNKRLKLLPLTRLGFAKFSELRSVRDRTGGLDDVIKMVEVDRPRVLVTLFSDSRDEFS